MGNGERYEVVAISGGGGGGGGGSSSSSSSSSSTCRARDAFEAFAAEISARQEVFNITTGLRFENRSVWSLKDLKHNGG